MARSQEVRSSCVRSRAFDEPSWTASCIRYTGTMNVGGELAEARGRLGLSLEDVSARTKISIERLTAIEQVDIVQLPALVYLKGFLREYATTVQLDPENITQRYLAELQDPLEPATRTVTDDAFFFDAFPSESEISDHDTAEQSFHRIEPDQPPLAVVLSTTPVNETIPPADNLLRHERAPAPEETEFLPAPTTAAPAARGMRLAILTALIGVLVGYGLAAIVYRDPGPDVTRAAEMADSPSPSAPGDQAASAPAEVESAARATASDADRAPEAPAAASRTEDRRAAAIRALERPQDSPEPAGEPIPSREVEPTVPSARAPSRTRSASEASSSLNGKWSLTTRIEATDYQPFNNLNLAYQVELRQEGDRITGSGTKWMENGKPIPARSRTPIAIDGVIKDRRLELRFTERGTRRETDGTFVMEIEPDGTLRGRFASSAANSAGSCLAQRIDSAPR